MKKTNKQYIDYPYFVDEFNGKDYLYLLKCPEYSPVNKKREVKETKEVKTQSKNKDIREIKNIIDDIFYGGKKIARVEKEYMVDNIEEVYKYIDTLTKAKQTAYFKKISAFVGYSLTEIKEDFELFKREIKESEERAKELKEKEKALEDKNNKREDLKKIGYYRSFQNVRLYEYIEIVEKVDTKKERFYILNIGGKEIEIISAEISQGQKLGAVLSRKIQSTTTKRANYLCEYLEYFDENIKIPIKRGVNRTGWVGSTFFIPNRNHDNIKLMTNEDGLKKRYRQKGNIELSKKLIYDMSYKKAFITFLAVLSSPLYGLIDDMKMFNQSTHISGGSGKGKTLSIQMGLSLFGNPKEYKSNFSQTLVGAEMYLAENYDMPCFIDETESAKKVDDIIDTFYMFSNKHGKARGTMSNNEVISRDIVSFRGHLLTSGEKNLETILEQSFSENLKNGVIRRVIDYEVEDDYFKSFNSSESYNHEEIMNLKRIAFNNYGLFVDEWINIISANKKKLNDDFAEISNKLNKNLADKELVYYAFVLVLKILFDNGLIPKESYVYQYKNILDMLEIEEEKRNDVKSPEVRFFENFKEYILMNKTMFGQGDFVSVKQLGEYNSDKTELYITKSGFGSILKEFNMSGNKKAIIKALKDSRVLIERQKRIMGSSTPLKLWAFNLKKNEEPKNRIKNHLADIPSDF